ncbi:MAG TPA: monovalent cation/H(+) antiporter subunit G [Acidimicrobiales bacterium]
MTGQVLLLAGALLTLLSGLCVARFDDVLLRMHALAKASTTGVLLGLTGAAVSLHNANDITTLLLALVLNLLTAPIAANLLSRATYRTSGIATRLDDKDELRVGRVGIGPDDER